MPVVKNGSKLRCKTVHANLPPEWGSLFPEAASSEFVEGLVVQSSALTARSWILHWDVGEVQTVVASSKLLVLTSFEFD